MFENDERIVGKSPILLFKFQQSALQVCLLLSIKDPISKIKTKFLKKKKEKTEILFNALFHDFGESHCYYLNNHEIKYVCVFTYLSNRTMLRNRAYLILPISTCLENQLKF